MRCKIKIRARYHRIYYTHEGQTLTANEWGKWLGVKGDTVKSRLDAGISIEDTIHSIQAKLAQRSGENSKAPLESWWATPKIRERRQLELSATFERKRLQRVAEREAILGKIDDCEIVNAENAMKLYKAGFTGVDIATRWCVGESQVWQLLNQHPNYKELAQDRLYYHQIYGVHDEQKAAARRLPYQGKRLPIADLEKHHGFSPGVIYSRLAHGWSEEDAASLPKQQIATLEHQGLTLTVKEWALRLDVTSHTIRWRIKHGWPIEKVLAPNANERLITFNGRTLNLTEWAAHIGISVRTIISRLYQSGWDVQKTFTTPVQKSGRLLTYDGKTLNLSQWSERTGISRWTIRTRLDTRNLSIEEALTTPTLSSGEQARTTRKAKKGDAAEIC